MILQELDGQHTSEIRIMMSNFEDGARHIRFLTSLLDTICIAGNMNLTKFTFHRVEFSDDTLFFRTTLPRFLLSQQNTLVKLRFRCCFFQGKDQMRVLTTAIQSSNLECICFNSVNFVHVSPYRSTEHFIARCLVQMSLGRSIELHKCVLSTFQMSMFVREMAVLRSPRTTGIHLNGFNGSVLTLENCRNLNMKLNNVSSMELEHCMSGDRYLAALLLGRRITPTTILLKALNLSHCGITDRGCEIIALMLSEYTPNLQRLILDSNCISDFGCTMIAESLQNNPVLQSLSIANSTATISNDSWRAFRRSLFNQESPYTVLSSNHTLTKLKLSSIVDDSRSRSDYMEVRRMLKMNRYHGNRRMHHPIIPTPPWTIFSAPREKLFYFSFKILISRGAFHVMKSFRPSFNVHCRSDILLLSEVVGLSSGNYGSRNMIRDLSRQKRNSIGGMVLYYIFEFLKIYMGNGFTVKTDRLNRKRKRQQHHQ